MDFDLACAKCFDGLIRYLPRLSIEWKLLKEGLPRKEIPYLPLIAINCGISPLKTVRDKGKLQR